MPRPFVVDPPLDARDQFTTAETLIATPVYGILKRVHEGEAVLVVTTTVARAQQVYEPAQVARALAILERHAGETISERRVQDWVDEAYAPIASEWMSRMRQLVAQHEVNLVQTNRPLNAHQDLAEKFDELFDGAEVVPATLADRYRRLLVEAPLEAAALRVPVSFAQRQVLKRRGRLRCERIGRMSYEIADVPYDSDRGLSSGSADQQP